MADPSQPCRERAVVVVEWFDMGDVARPELQRYSWDKLLFTSTEMTKINAWNNWVKTLCKSWNNMVTSKGTALLQLAAAWLCCAPCSTLCILVLITLQSLIVRPDPKCWEALPFKRGCQMSVLITADKYFNLGTLEGATCLVPYEEMTTQTCIAWLIFHGCHPLGTRCDAGARFAQRSLHLQCLFVTVLWNISSRRLHSSRTVLADLSGCLT